MEAATKATLLRVAEGSSEYGSIPLQGPEVLVGRSKTATCRITDNRIDLKHGCFKCHQGRWTVKDVSCVGLFVNKERLPPKEAFPLNAGDYIQFGPTNNFVFEFTVENGSGSPRVKRARTSSSDRGHNSEYEKAQGQLKGKQMGSESMKQNLRSSKKQFEKRLSQMSEERKELQESLEKVGCMVTELSAGIASVEDSLEESRKKVGCMLAELSAAMESGERKPEPRERKVVCEKVVRKRVHSQATKWLPITANERQYNLRSGSKERTTMKEQPNRSEAPLKQTMKSVCIDMKRVKMSKMPTDKAVVMKTSPRVSQQGRKNRKESLEEQHRGDLEKKVSKLCKTVQHLKEDSERIQKQLQAGESHMKVLEEKLNESRQSALNQQVGDIMQLEMQCVICNELLIQAVTLNCSHSFCKLCLFQWTKKKEQCPICRTKIRSEVRSIVIDNFIAKIIESFSADVKARREELLKERKALDLERVVDEPRTERNEFVLSIRHVDTGDDDSSDNERESSYDEDADEDYVPENIPEMLYESMYSDSSLDSSSSSSSDSSSSSLLDSSSESSSDSSSDTTSNVSSSVLYSDHY